MRLRCAIVKAEPEACAVRLYIMLYIIRKKEGCGVKYRHIIFDVDGTIADTEYAVLKSLQDVVRIRLGREMSFEELRFVKGIPGWEAFRQLGFAEKDFAQVMREWESGMRAMNDRITIFSGAAELVDALAASGCYLGIATSKTRDQYIKDFERFDVSARFAVSVTCEDTDDPKPGAGPLLEYMKRTGAKPQEMLYIGDAVYDAMTAKAAGVDFALAVWGATEEIEAKYLPKHPLQLLDMIR